MGTWIESQSASVIVVVVFGLCFAVAALVFAIVSLLSHRRVAEDLQTISPVMLTPIGVIGGLLIAFLAARVWTNVDHAYRLVAQEANAVVELAGLADELPPEIRAKVHDGARAYAAWVRAEDWPHMMAGATAIRSAPPGLIEATGALVAFDPQTTGQKVIQQSALATIERALEARRDRLLLSRQVIARSQWTVVWALYLLIMLVIGFVHMKRPVTAAVALSVFAAAFGLCMILLVINDGPFRTGGFTLGPSLLTEAAAD